MRLLSTSTCADGTFSITSETLPEVTVTVSLVPPTASAIFRLMGTDWRTVKSWCAASKPAAETVTW